MSLLEKKLLIVEDDLFLSSLLKNRFQKEGLVVIVARDGDEAIKTLKAIKPDLILLDLILPGKSGFEVLQAMQSEPQLRRDPVMVISNLSHEMEIKQAKQLGAIEYFIKARTSIDDMVKRVKAFLEPNVPKN